MNLIQRFTMGIKNIILFVNNNLETLFTKNRMLVQLFTSSQESFTFK